MYVALRMGVDMPMEYYRWELARECGWTLEYIDNLSMQDFQNWIQIRDAKVKAAKPR